MDTYYNLLLTLICVLLYCIVLPYNTVVLNSIHFHCTLLHCILQLDLLFTTPIHENSSENRVKKLEFFQVCHIIKILLNGLTYNPADLAFCSEKIRSKLVKYSSGLYVKPFNKIYVLHACLFYKSIKQNTKTEKEAAKLFYSFQKQCFY